jgi:hypothetical protein
MDDPYPAEVTSLYISLGDGGYVAPQTAWVEMAPRALHGAKSPGCGVKHSESNIRHGTSNLFTEHHWTQRTQLFCRCTCNESPTLDTLKLVEQNQPVSSVVWHHHLHRNWHPAITGVDRNSTRNSRDGFAPRRPTARRKDAAQKCRVGMVRSFLGQKREGLTKPFGLWINMILYILSV